MCLRCHQNLNDEQVLEQLQQTKDNPQFETWNSTTWKHMSIVLGGHNGEEARQLALDLVEEYHAWSLKQRSSCTIL